MYLNFGKINIKNVIFFIIALIASIILAYYLVLSEYEYEDENKLKNFGDYFNYIFNKVYFIYVIIFMTFVIYMLLHFLFDNRESIRREVRSRGQTLYNATLGPNFINRSIQGGANATNKLYNYSNRAYNYLRPNIARFKPVDFGRTDVFPRNI